MDMSKITRSTWIVTGGTIVTLIGTLFLDWYSFSASVDVGLGNTFSVSASVGAWDTGSIGKLAVLGSVVMLAGVTVPGLAKVAKEIARQSMMIGYLNAFTMYTVTSGLAVVFVLMVRGRKAV